MVSATAHWSPTLETFQARKGTHLNGNAAVQVGSAPSKNISDVEIHSFPKTMQKSAMDHTSLAVTVQSWGEVSN